MCLSLARLQRRVSGEAGNPNPPLPRARDRHGAGRRDDGAGDQTLSPQEVASLEFEEKKQLPETGRIKVVDREVALNAIVDYTVKVVIKDESLKSGSNKGTKIFSTLGIPGTGKTVFSSILVKTLRSAFELWSTKIFKIM